MDRHCLVQRGEIAETDDWPRIAADRFVVDAIENPHRAVAATREEERVELRRAQVTVELLDTLVIGAGEISAMALRDVFRDRDARAARLEIAFRLLDFLGFGGR